MALKKLLTFGSKTGDYWKILGIYPDSDHSNSTIKVALYKDKESRENDESGYVYSQSFSVPGINHSREAAYKSLEGLDFFSGAENC